MSILEDNMNCIILNVFFFPPISRLILLGAIRLNYLLFLIIIKAL